MYDMYSLHNNSKILEELKSYMLYSISDENLNRKIKENFLTNDTKNDKEPTNIGPSRRLTHINYNKLESKYNEKNMNTKKYYTDKYFWCFYKLVNNLLNKDLETLNFFKEEKDYKINAIETVRNSKDKFKQYKMKKNLVEDDLVNNKNISLYTFEALCMLNNINLVILKDNGTYTYFNYNNLEDTTINLKNYNVIKLNYNKNSSVSKNFNIDMELNLTETDFKAILDKYYYVENLEKPLKAYSSYKLDELIEICDKLKIVIYSIGTKKKKKSELYEEILKVLC